MERSIRKEILNQSSTLYRLNSFSNKNGLRPEIRAHKNGGYFIKVFKQGEKNPVISINAPTEEIAFEGLMINARIKGYDVSDFIPAK